MHAPLDDDDKAWVKHVFWTALTAACSAIATKAAEMLVEEWKERRKARRKGPHGRHEH